MSVRIPKDVCPYCRHELSAAWEPGGNAPQIDDFTMCIACGGWLVFGKGMILHKPTLLELDALARSRKANALQDLWTRFMRHKGAKTQ